MMTRSSWKTLALSLAVASSVVVLSQPARAIQTAYEGFRPSFPIYANGGTGFAGSWTQGGFNAFASRYTTRERSLCHPQLDASEGGSVSGQASPSINGAIRTLALALGADNTTAYISFLIQPQGTLNEGIFGGFFGLTLNGSLGNDFFVGKPGGGALEQYVIENRGGAGQVPSGTPAVVGRTTLLVVKVQFLSGSDTFTLYVDPTPGRPEPGSGIVKIGPDLGVVSRIGIYSTGEFGIDEIRIGTTYADVVPSRDNKPDNEFPGCP